jgi:hypothetical protein
MDRIGAIQPFPSTSGNIGTTGRVVDIRPVLGHRADAQGNRLAELRVEPLQRAAPTGVGVLVGGGAVSVLHQVDTDALPPARNPEPDINGDGEPDPLGTTLGQPDDAQRAARPGAAQTQRQPPGAALLPPENPAQLNQAEQEQVRRLQLRDAAVRSEEESHQAVAGAYAGPIQYDYTRGPDNRLYVAGGSVNMSVAGITDPDLMAGALRSMQSAGSIPGATSVADLSATARARRNLSNLLLAQSDGDRQSNTAQLAQQAYTNADQLSAQGNGAAVNLGSAEPITTSSAPSTSADFKSGGLGASVNFAIGGPGAV